MTTENDDEGSREQWSRWEGAESQVSSHAGAALCSAVLCACCPVQAEWVRII